MSDASFSDDNFVPVAPKRKSTTSAAAPKAKKARGSGKATSDATPARVSNPEAEKLVASTLAKRSSETDPQVLKDDLLTLATYARQLENALAAALAGGTGSGAAPAKTKEELKAAAAKIRHAAMSGIKKQMSWKPSCKTGTAKWTYDGICPDPAVFGVLMRLDGPPTWKMKKFSKDDFEAAIGEVVASVRYDDLYITSKDVTVRWSETGEFKFSGSYGKLC
ncbi:hypothetical protein DENSPDRAFT_808447 [Dentipellis sp. KUC8613]|nr:hypothetical protein DENSPDRAFT_808447 [Dentipellis sp. KUC8613]